MNVDIMKKFNREDFQSPPREGAYLYGLFMAGARWDTQAGTIVNAKLKELDGLLAGAEALTEKTYDIVKGKVS